MSTGRIFQQPALCSLARTAQFVVVLAGVILFAAVARSEITTRGNAILRNGAPFVTRGVIFAGFSEPEAQLAGCQDQYVYCKMHLETRDYFWGRGKYAGANALDLAVRNWNVNAIRINLNQSALDPESESHSVAYEEEIRAIVKEARKRGLVVFLALFGHGRNRSYPEYIDAANPPAPLDTEVTRRAALTLAKDYGSDGDVVLELLNEPWSPTSIERGWRLWLHGGVLQNPRSKHDGYNFPGVASIVRDIRQTGARNAIVVQGLLTSFAGLPSPVPDPLNRIIYSVHPFFEIGRDLAWDEKFGELSRTLPVVITAWQAQGADAWCARYGLDTMARFLKYLGDRKIGVIGFGFDAPFTITRDFRRFFDEPTRAGPHCAPWSRAGELLQQHFLLQR